MSIAFQLMISLLILAITYKFFDRDHQNRLIRLLSVFVGIWTIGYGVLGPIFIYMAELNLVLPNYEYIGLASLLLSLSYLIFMIIWNRWSPSIGIFIPDKSVMFRSIFSLWIIFFVGTVFSPAESSIKFYFAIIMLVPSICLLYIYADKRRKLILALLLHLITVLFCIQDEFFLVSKERLILITIFPFILLIIMRHKFSLNFRWVSVGFLSATVFIASSLIVSSTRNDVEISVGEKGSDLIVERLVASAGRLGVVDTTGALIKNELSDHPIRPTLPIWSFAGIPLSVVPAIVFEYPQHSREMLPLGGYITSHDDVNLAATTAGHLLWSFGWIGLLPSLVFFWSIFFSLIHLSALLPKPFCELALISHLITCFRLETTAYGFLGTIFSSVLVYLIFSCLALLIKVNAGQSKKKINRKINLA
ncbi:putative membrane protein [SAR86 cluster bacterium SAR86E]|uniref:Putative membrane protein n=1 Tax=SAR86 cluster bacterium SAR86E TaxID=1208365 RepID=K6GGD4_9GAMM|nr:putative membrane protein [SAR86 cluster bacterium SAR86E]